MAGHHHDHIRDAVYPQVEGLLCEGWREALPDGTTVVLDTIKDLVSRFNRSLICQECNAADGQAKIEHRGIIDPAFSFTPAEIGRFVTSRVNEKHVLDLDAAVAIWREQEDSFRWRKALLDELILRLASGDLASDLSGRVAANMADHALNAGSVLETTFRKQMKDTDELYRLDRFRTEFLSRSVCKDSVSLSKSIKRPPRQAVTDAEYVAYIDAVSPERWDRAPEDWTCGICQRGKREILRRSKKGKLTGSIRLHFDYRFENEPEQIARRSALFPGYTNKTYIGDLPEVEVCSDCRDVPTRLSQWDRSLSEPYLGALDIAGCIRAAPHEQHEIDFKTARDLARRNELLKSADQAYRSFRAKAAGALTRAEIWHREGFEHQQCIDLLACDLIEEGVTQDPLDANELSAWLSDEGRRLQDKGKSG